MIDTLMAIWNRGYGGRGILVSLAFLLICISISLLLVTVGSSWSALWSHHGPTTSRSDTLGTSLTATTDTHIKVATPAGTPLVYAPTVTPTTNPCLLTPTAGKASHTLTSPTAQHGSGGHSVTPTPTPHPRPTATATPRPQPTSTPVPSPTPTAIATATSTPNPTPTTTTTPTVTPTVGATPTVPTHRRGGTPVPTPSATATSTHGQNKTAGGANCSSIYSGSGDSVGLTFTGSIGAILVRNLWIILGGSTLGTMLFYITLYFLNRKRTKNETA